jgi:peptide/nickel transport system substrate-binding protein
MRSFIAVIISLMLSAAVSQAKEASPSNPPYGGTLVWGVAYKPTIINPILTTQSVSASLQGLIFNQLIRWNAKGEIEPDLAESWEVSDDGLVYTFHLRKGVRFHDGVECTAEDVKFTFDKIIDPVLASPFRQLFQLAGEFKSPDPYTFQVVLNKPSSSFIYNLIRPIAPKHLLENTDLKSTDFNHHPIGTGPFKFKEWSKDDQITLEYNADYYEGRPYLDKIVVKTYADSRQLWAAIMRQEVDLAMFIEREDFDIIKDDPLFKSYAFPIDYYYAISYDLDDSILADQKIREAIAYGTNREEIIKKVAFGYGLECNGPFYPESIGFNPAVRPIEFNPEKAKQLLAEAGWQDLNSDGILEKSGQDLEVRMLVDERSDIYRRMAMLIRQHLQEIGIRLIVQLYPDEAALTKNFLVQNRSQAQLKLLWAGIDPEQLEIGKFLQNSQGVHNLWNYKNYEVERYLGLAKTSNDRKKKKWIYQEVHRFIYKEQPVDFLYFSYWFHIVSSKFKNTDDLFTLSMPYDSMRKWFITR